MSFSTRQLLPHPQQQPHQEERRHEPAAGSDAPRPSRAERHRRQRTRGLVRWPRRPLVRVGAAALALATAVTVLLSAEGLLPGEPSGRRVSAGPSWNSQLARAVGGGPSAAASKGSKQGAAASSTRTQTDAKVSGQLKPVLGGLLDRQKLPDKAYWSVLSGFVVQVDWSELQAAPGAPLPPNNPIDQAIAAARAAHLRIKLRVDAGTMAPEWVKRLGGNPIPVQFTNPVTGELTSGTIGRFWTAAFGRAYQDLQNKLAARYDNVPEIAQTSITRCITFFAEPFLRQARRIPATANALLAAGYSDTADETCQKEQIQAAAVWKHTRSGLSFNPYQRLHPDGSVTTDEKFTEEMMRYCRAVLGARCVLENHSIRTTSQSVWYGPMYAAIRALGGPISYQTAAPNRVGDLLGTLAWAAGQGASSVELPVSYRDLSPSALAPYNSRLLGIARTVR